MMMYVYNHKQIVLENAKNMVSTPPFPLSMLENGKMQTCVRRVFCQHCTGVGKCLE